MAKEEIIRVELISNPSVKRNFTASSWKTNERGDKWRLIDGQAETVLPAKKKEVAENVAPPVKEVKEIADPELDQLRADYLQKFGKPADKRFKAEKIKTLLNETN
jgi:hypothetical protein